MAPDNDGRNQNTPQGRFSTMPAGTPHTPRQPALGDQPTLPPAPQATPTPSSGASVPSQRSRTDSRIIFGVILFAIVSMTVFMTHRSEEDAEKSTLKQQITQLRAELEIANAAVDQYKADATRAKQKLESVQQQLVEAQKPEVAVDVSFNRPAVGNYTGYYARITNRFSNYITITAEIRRPSTGKVLSRTLTINGGAFCDIGELEGWAFYAGDTLTLSQSGHKSLVWKVD